MTPLALGAALLALLPPVAWAKGTPVPLECTDWKTKNPPNGEFGQETLADPKHSCELGSVNNMKPGDVFKNLNYRNDQNAKISISGMAVDSLYCPACFLYATRVQNPRQQDTQLANFVVQAMETEKGKPSHQLVIPNKPCRGVEDALSAAGCHGETIWDAGLQQLINGKPNPTDLSWVMSMNANGYRTQHQMHLHLTPIDPKLLALLKSMSVQSSSGGKWYSLTCPNAKGTSRTLGLCTALSGPATPSPSNPAGENVWAKPFAVPSSTAIATALSQNVKPFSRVYGGAFTTAAERWTTAVVRLSATSFAIIAMDRPAECVQDTLEAHGNPADWPNTKLSEFQRFGKCFDFK